RVGTVDAADRDDLEGRHHQPMNVQWGGTLEALRAALTAQGWRTPAAFDPVSAMNWLAPEPVIDDMPVLPEVHDGRHEELLMIAPRPAGEATLTVLRLWPSGLELAEANTPLWLGKVTQLFVDDRVPLLRYLVTGDEHAAPLETLADDLRHARGIQTRILTRSGHGHVPGWQGRVLLAWEWL
ncbi:MAG: LssY C-terminal domain-containing protein, partial [Thiohalobacterales bacterium]|nr:LssY C-terminal domain-containing protein [Thiohalobacterales bacterium]